jgi:hypothetical protein
MTMDNVFTIEMTELPLAGGLSGDPTVLRGVGDLLSRESHFRKVNQILEANGCVLEYRSVIDCVLVELIPQFKDACLEFYDGKGRPLASQHPADTIEAIDVELGLALEVLLSKDWPSWDDFKRDFKGEIKWEQL